MTGYGIRLGSALMTVVDPWPGHEVEFNRWYERDHLYGGASLGPSVFSAGRFVARRREKAKRGLQSEQCDPDLGTMLALYWLVGDGSDYWTWSAGNAERLAAEGRMSPRGSVRSILSLQDPWVEERDQDGVPAEVALDRRFPGLVVTIVAASDAADRAELADWYRTSCVRPLVTKQRAAALCVGFCPQPVALTRGSPRAQAEDEPAESRWLVGLWFLDEEPGADPATLLGEHQEAMQAGGLGAVVWASPFVATVPGTDRYMDQLWLT